MHGLSAGARLLLPVLLAFTTYPQASEARCLDDWLAVDEIRDGDLVELRATNRQEFPITYSVRVRSDALANGRERVRGTLDAKKSEKIAVVPGTGDDIRVSCSWTIGDDQATHDDDHLYLLPYAAGASYRVLQGFSSRFSHRGIEEFAVDFKMSVGTPVHAARGGVIARVVESNDKGCWEDGCGQYANFIVVMHDDGTTGEYYHLQKDGALVEVGDKVVAGQRIGLSGNTGHTALPHLHFAVYRATRGGQPQSVPISFVSANGVVYRPRQGHHYQAINRQHAGD
ncbi:MAG: M23 family metallopeptidase [Gammaproteobacteria bacterium]|nr:M23 family metallopeptidase [Gammaproteobacteria bacterium]